jgi:hypothetical protein
MDAYAFARAPHLIRATFLVRETILALLASAESSKHELASAFGYDEKTFDFVSQGNSLALFKLATNYLKAGAISFEIDNALLKKLLLSIHSNETFHHESSKNEAIYSHRQVIRELVMYLSDSLHDLSTFKNNDNFSDFDPDILRMIARLDAKKLDLLANKMVKRRCIKFVFNKNKIRERTYSYMRYEHREGIKDMLVSKKATNAMMSFLFSEENEDSVKNRRFRLGVDGSIGRPKSTSMNVYVEFIIIWTTNQNLSALERFLMTHRQLGLGFDVLWNMYYRAKQSGEFDQHILDAVARSSNSSNLACQIKAKKTP